AHLLRQLLQLLHQVVGLLFQVLLLRLLLGLVGRLLPGELLHRVAEVALLLGQVAGLLALLLVERPLVLLRLGLGGGRPRFLGEVWRQPVQGVRRVALPHLGRVAVFLLQVLPGLVHRLAGLLQRPLVAIGRQLGRLLVQLLLLFADLFERVLILLLGL